MHGDSIGNCACAEAEGETESQHVAYHRYWRPGFNSGHFKRQDGAPPAFRSPMIARRIQLVAGWFKDTLPPFLAAHPDEPVALLHLDCDIYSSCNSALNQCLDARCVYNPSNLNHARLRFVYTD